MKNFGELIGKAFQIQDDILEIVSDVDSMGKNLNSDIILNKKTFLYVYSFLEMFIHFYLFLALLCTVIMYRYYYNRYYVPLLFTVIIISVIMYRYI